VQDFASADLVLSKSPQPDNGATVFRPAYFGSNKHLFSTADMDVNLGILPRLSSTPEIDSQPAAAWQHEGLPDVAKPAG
jgi:hypothetical protein